jgi:uncharacterized protein
MTFLLTGSSGLIGTAVVEALHAHGHDTVRLVRPATGTSTALEPPTTVTWDPDRGMVDLAALEAAGPFDGVVHLAGAGVADRRWSPARRQVILRSRTDSTELLVSSLLQLSPRPPVLVSASAIGYYGDRGDEELTEGSSPGAGFLAGVVEAWEGATRPAAEAGMRVVTVRTGLVLAPEGGLLGRLLPLFRTGVGGRLGSGAQWMSWITLEDEVAVVLRALTDGRLEGPVNATAPGPVTNAGFTTALGRAVHRPAVVPVPAAALRLALGRAMADETALVSQRVAPAVLTALGFEFAHPDLDGALAAVTGRPGPPPPAA